MQSLNSEQSLLNYIKYGATLLIIIISLIITSIFIFQKNEYLKKETKQIEEDYITQEKIEVKNLVNRVHTIIKVEEKNSLSELKKKIKKEVYNAHAIATSIYEQNRKKGTYSKEETLKQIKETLRAIRFNDGNGYIFIDDKFGNKVLHLIKELEGQNLLEFKDARGYQFVKTIVDTIDKKTERFDEYFWYKGTNRSKSYKKIGFYKYFEPYDLAIGSGEYLDDFTKTTQRHVQETLNAIKFKKPKHLFIYDYQGLSIVNPKKEIVGTNRYNMRNKQGKYGLRENILFTLQHKEGFRNYKGAVVLNKENITNEKISYFMLFEKWKWIIGSGFYLEELQEKVKLRKESLEESNTKTIQKIIIISILITLLMIFISFYLSNKIKEIFLKYKHNLIQEIKEKRLEASKNEKLHENLIESEQEFKTLFELSNIGLIIRDKEGKFTKVNKRLLKMLGYDKEFLLNKNCRHISSKEHESEENLLFKQLTNKEITNYNIEKSFIRKDGSTFEAILTMASILNEKGEIVNILSSVIDISELKQKEKLLVQQSKMATMGEMIGNIAHQWKQPLSLISMSNGIIKISLGDNKDFVSEKDVIDAVENINTAVKNLNHTIDDFRNFFNPNKERSLFTISKALDDTFKLIKAQFKNNNIELITSIEEVELFGSQNELQQVLINILKNAKDELVKKETSQKRYILISISKTDNMATIKIKDNAGGIPEEITEKIFDPYFTTKDETQGTGIGLYMSKQIIEGSMKGSITSTNVEFNYEGENYKGAEFILSIPLDLRTPKRSN